MDNDSDLKGGSGKFFLINSPNLRFLESSDNENTISKTYYESG
jgi:hypothetical protein